MPDQSRRRFDYIQRNYDFLSLTYLQALQAKLQQAIDNRLAGNGATTIATTEIEIAGLLLRCESLAELHANLADVTNAIAKRQPGSTFTQASFCE